MKLAQKKLNELKEIQDRLTAPPWVIATFLRMITTDPGHRALVHDGHCRRVANLAEDLEVDSLHTGDEVFLSKRPQLDYRKIGGRSSEFGETATFDRYTADGRLVIRRRDEETDCRCYSISQSNRSEVWRYCSLGPGDMDRN